MCLLIYWLKLLVIFVVSLCLVVYSCVLCVMLSVVSVVLVLFVYEMGSLLLKWLCMISV